MPVNEDTAHLNEQLGEWFQKYHPEFLNTISGQQFHQLLRTLIEVKDVFTACKLLERIAKVKANEELIIVLLKDYNDHLLDKLEALKLMEPRKR